MVIFILQNFTIMYVLGVFGPWQLILLLLLFVVPGIVILIVFTSRAGRNRGQQQNAAAMEETPAANVESNKSDPESGNVDQLIELNKLRESGVLTNDEFEVEKKKLLGN